MCVWLDAGGLEMGRERGQTITSGGPKEVAGQAPARWPKQPRTEINADWKSSIRFRQFSASIMAPKMAVERAASGRA